MSHESSTIALVSAFVESDLAQDFLRTRAPDYEVPHEADCIALVTADAVDSSLSPQDMYGLGVLTVLYDEESEHGALVPVCSVDMAVLDGKGEVEDQILARSFEQMIRSAAYGKGVTKVVTAANDGPLFQTWHQHGTRREWTIERGYFQLSRKTRAIEALVIRHPEDPAAQAVYVGQLRYQDGVIQILIDESKQAESGSPILPLFDDVTEETTHSDGSTDSPKGDHDE